MDKLEIFKDCVDKIEKEKIDDIDSTNIDRNILMNAYNTVQIRDFSKQIDEILDEHFKGTRESYKDMLIKIKYLARHFGCNDSLSASILFSYLLWNGYLSRFKDFKYQAKGRNLYYGHYAYDIMSGIGVCLNYSDMLKDVLNEQGYDAAVLACFMNPSCSRTTYYPEIQVKMSRADFQVPFVGLLSALSSKFGTKMNNHAINLIQDKDGFFIYDATNLAGLNVVDSSSAKIIGGKYCYSIDPMGSFIHNYDKKSFDVIGNFITDSKAKEVSKMDYIEKNEYIVNLLNDNKDDLNDFYSDIKHDIRNIDMTNKTLKIGCD